MPEPFVPAAAGVTPASIAAYVAEQWPVTPPDKAEDSTICHEVSGRHVVVSQKVLPGSIRPGGFISGPTQFAIADIALWYACFGAIGLEAMALTSELSIRFVRPAIGNELHARADLLSVGKRNIVGSVMIWTDDEDKPVSICQGTYVAPVRQ